MIRLLATLLLCLPVAGVAQTTPSTMTVKDGQGSTQRLRVEQGSDGSLATHMVPEVTLTPNASLVFPATVGNSSTPLFTGGLAIHNLIVFNNSVSGSVWLWCNPAGGAAAPGSGVVVAPGGGSYYWAGGLTTVPACISGTQTGGASVLSVSVSGAGG